MTGRRAPASKKNLEDAERRGLAVAFQDEAHFQQATGVARMWALKGSRPTVKQPPCRRSVKYSGFVVPKTGELSVGSPGWFTWESTVESLSAFLRGRRGRVCVVLDNASWHKKAAKEICSQKRFAWMAKRVEFLFLPPYSPDLNPMEMVWRTVRREVTRNRYFRTLDELASATGGYFALFKNPNEKFRRLCSFK